MNLEKLVIKTFSDKECKNPINKTGFVLQINPSSLAVSKAVSYTDNNQGSSSNNNSQFSKLDEESLKFDFYLDDTGVLDNITPKNTDIRKRLQEFEKNVYTINKESHQPAFVKIFWGNFSFTGKLSSLNYDYSLFNANGKALRVKVSVSFIGHESNKHQVLNSPDVTRTITFKEGDELSYLCHEIYNDSSYVYDVADFNNFSSIKNIKPGTKVTFPAITHYE